MEHNRIQVFTESGAYLGQRGTPGAASGEFSALSGVAVDADGNVLVSDGGNHRIQEFSGDGAYLGEWGTLGTASGQFRNPFGVAEDGAGNVFVVDYGNSRIEKFGSQTATPARPTSWGRIKALYR